MNDACLKCKIIGIFFLLAVTLLEAIVVSWHLPYTQLGFLFVLVVAFIFNTAIFFFATKYRDTYHKCEEENCDE